MSVKGAIHSIETFGSVDGPGVRFVIFLKGCAMRCQYCHNPDTWKCGEPDTDSEALLKRAMRYRSYWGKNGGITVSGGEPLLQIDFLLDLFQKAKKENIHTVLDTTGKSNRNILDLAKYLSDIGKPVWIRHVLVPGINDSDEDLQKLDTFLQTLHNVARVEILPYHTLGAYKWEELGYTYAIKDVLPPDKALVKHANELLHTAQYDS